MTPSNAPSSTVERLARDLFDPDPPDPLAAELLDWLAGSSRFRAFAVAYRDKIRKKLRTAADPESVRDVRTELWVAHRLLADRRIELTFEPYGSGKTGPDLSIAFRGIRAFNLEVTRLRTMPRLADRGGPLLAKLRQLPPSVPNAVLIAIEAETAEALDVAAATRALRTRADAKDEEFFVARGFDGTRSFYERYLRLAAVLVACEGAVDDARATLWINRSARIAVPAPAARACLAGLRSDDSGAG